MEHIEINFNRIIHKGLFSKDKNGKIRFWLIESNKDSYVTFTGVIDGNDSIQFIKHNITPVSETMYRDIDKQVYFEVEAKYRYKSNGGYISVFDLGLTYSKTSKEFLHYGNTVKQLCDFLKATLPDYKSDNKGFLKPMLAKKFRIPPSHHAKNTYPMYSQPKINGIRALARWEEVEEGDGMFKRTIEKVIFTSREGKVYNLPHISKHMTKEMFFDKDGEELVYDGELYIHGYSLNFIRSAVPMILDNGTISNASGDTSLLEYWIFDLAIPKPQTYRISLLNSKLHNYQIDAKTISNVYNKVLVKVPTKVILSDLDAIMDSEYYIARGFEGAILRNPDATYNFGVRGKDMTKLKKALHTECLIIDVIPKDREPETGLFILRNDINNETFECNPMGTYEERMTYLKDKELFIGKKATVKYYERSGIKQCPFHANVETIRDYE